MKQVWKFPIQPGRGVEMPVGAEIISMQTQKGVPTLWAIVDPANSLEKVNIHVAGTGHNLPDNIERFIGTFQIDDGAFVFHVFVLSK